MNTDNRYHWPHKDLLDVTQLSGEDVRHLPLCSAAAFENAREGRGALRCGPLERGDGRP